MEWYLCFCLAAACLLGFFVYAFTLIRNKNTGIRHNLRKPVHMLFLGVFTADFFLILPVYSVLIADEPLSAVNRFLHSVLFSGMNTLQAFAVNLTSEFILDHVRTGNALFTNIYSTCLSGLFLLSPLLTLGVVLSFFRNLVASLRFLLGSTRRQYVFSSLNERSLALAQSIRRSAAALPAQKTPRLVFTDCANAYDADLEQANRCGAVCFKKPLRTVRFYPWTKDIRVFFMNQDENRNVSLAMETQKRLAALLAEREKKGKPNRTGYTLYVFAQSRANALLLGSAERSRDDIVLRRLNPNQYLIYRHLDRFLDEGDGRRLFAEAKDGRITALIVGMGAIGSEMFRALLWYCQAEGYFLRLVVFDKDPLLHRKLRCAYPGLLQDALEPEAVSEPHAITYESREAGEAAYSITVHAGTDAGTDVFAKTVQNIKNVSYAFVALGDDDKNIETAVFLRTLLLRTEQSPVIESVVYSHEKYEALERLHPKGAENGRTYDIRFFGSIRQVFSDEVILNEDLYARGRLINAARAWADGKNEAEIRQTEEDYIRYDYNYKAAQSSAIRKSMRERLLSLGLLQQPREDSMLRMEHCGWDAFARTEGFVRGEERDFFRNTHDRMQAYDRLAPEARLTDVTLTMDAAELAALARVFEDEAG